LIGRSQKVDFEKKSALWYMLMGTNIWARNQEFLASVAEKTGTFREDRRRCTNTAGISIASDADFHFPFRRRAYFATWTEKSSHESENLSEKYSCSISNPAVINSLG
jgi:hypothetical protein